MDCPICRKKDLSPLLPNCTDCKTDMKVVLTLNDQNERIVEMAKQRTELEGEIAILKKQNNKDSSHRRGQIFKILSLCLLLPFAFWICRKKTVAPPVMITLPSINADSIVQFYKLQLIDLQQDSAAICTQKVRSIRYTLKKDDTLAALGELFYNNKYAGFRIARDNFLSVDDYKNLPTGKILKINFR